MFLTAYLEYFGLYASILISLKSNVTPQKKALVFYKQEISTASFNPTNQVLTQYNNENSNLDGPNRLSQIYDRTSGSQVMVANGERRILSFISQLNEEEES
jgi:hypothetical protein